VSDTDKRFAEAVNDLRAFMDSFQSTDYKEMHLVDNQGEIFIAREGGGPNPLLGYAPHYGVAAPSASRTSQDVVAPHVGTVSSLCVENGERVAAGAVLLELSVLEESISVETPIAGTVIEVCVELGELAEFGTTLVRIGT